ncbi:MAG: modification methylase [Thermoplasmata archaeon]|nr:modification methylase [Thermoplasmata archaeon]
MHGPLAYLREHRVAVESALAARDLAPRILTRSAESMPEVADASVHLVVTSPPYPMIEMWDAQLAAQTGVAPTAQGGFAASHAMLARVWAECWRVLSPGGMLAINVGDATRSVEGDFRCALNHVQVARDCEALGFASLVPILWKKPTNKPNAFLGSGFLPTNAYVTLDCEFILLFRKGSARAFPAKDPLRYASQMSKAERDVWFSQLWDVRGAAQDAEGTAPFPPEIPYRLVRMFSCLGDTVLDPFAGTGTTLAIARALGRKAIGCEINPDLALAKRIPAEAPLASAVLDALDAHYAATSGAAEKPNDAPARFLTWAGAAASGTRPPGSAPAA